jgi:hypothetical protein
MKIKKSFVITLLTKRTERKFSVPRERSMPDLDDLVVGAVALSGGELVGRIRLQKVMYPRSAWDEE